MSLLTTWGLGSGGTATGGGTSLGVVQVELQEIEEITVDIVQKEIVVEIDVDEIEKEIIISGVEIEIDDTDYDIEV